MNPIGAPFSVQNTDGSDWLVQWSNLPTDEGETVGFTVAIPKDLAMTVQELRLASLNRAIAFLQTAVEQLASPSP